MKKKPLGISILSILYFIGGIIFIVAGTLNGLKSLNGTKNNNSVILFIFIVSIIEIFAGIGMWREKYWSWYLACFLMSLNIIKQIIIFLERIINIGISYSINMQDLFFALWSILLSISILYYLSRPSIIRYFHLEKLTNRKLLIRMILIFLLSIFLYIIFYFSLLQNL